MDDNQIDAEIGYLQHQFAPLARVKKSTVEFTYDANGRVSKRVETTEYETPDDGGFGASVPEPIPNLPFGATRPVVGTAVNH